MGKSKRTLISGDTETDPSKFPSPPKRTDPWEGDLKAAMRQEMQERIKQMKETLATEYKKSMDEQISQIKEELLNNMKDSIQKELKDLNDKVASLTSRNTELEKHIEELEEKLQAKNDQEANKEIKGKTLEGKVQYLINKDKRNNLRIVGIPEGEETGKGGEQIVRELLAENFPTLWKETSVQIQEVKRVPNKIDPNKPTPRHMVIQMAKNKEKDDLLKAIREKKNLKYKGRDIRIKPDLPFEIIQARRQWNGIFKRLNERNCEPRVRYPAKLSFIWEDRLRTFSNTDELELFMQTNPSLYNILRDELHNPNPRL